MCLMALRSMLGFTDTSERVLIEAAQHNKLHIHMNKGKSLVGLRDEALLIHSWNVFCWLLSATARCDF